MPADGSPPISHTLFESDQLTRRERYQLLTSVVVPRPIGWLSTVSGDRVPNLAPFSYFAALASSPMLVGASIGERHDGVPKDTLSNIRTSRAFCVNVVTRDQFERMNATSEGLPPEMSEFQRCGIPIAWSAVVDAPFVADAKAVLECVLTKEVDLAEAPNTLVIGRVQRVRLIPELLSEPGTLHIDPRILRPVGRLGGSEYAMPGEIRELKRPRRS